MIRFLAPWWLLCVAAVVVLAGVYVWAQLRRKKYAVRFSNVNLLRSIAPRVPGWRRHLIAGALAVGVLALSLGMARPAVDVDKPLERATVVLAIDVSLSMNATDVAPNRLKAAQNAAKLFVKQLPKSYNLSLVSFAKTANVLVPATKDRAQVTSGIDHLKLAESTAIGEAIFASLQSIANVPADGAKKAAPARIVLLSDGFTTSGRSNDEATQAALAAKVPVSTIAFGTPNGSVAVEGTQVPVPVDGDALHKIASQTNGKFYTAVTASQLKNVYKDLGSSVGKRTEARDVTRWFLGIGLIVVLASVCVSLLWTGRIT